ncbi:unnamed protein product [Phaeothamnion confervicola]
MRASLLVLLAVPSYAFFPSGPAFSWRRPKTSLSMSSAEGGDKRTPVKDMKTSEIKSELAVRGIPFEDCFEKSELVQRLEFARSQGRADPNLVSEFNKRSMETRMDPNLSEAMKDIDPEALKDMTAADGTMPGGLTPDQMQKLMGNPEVMALLQNPKLQELMKRVMSGGPEAIREFEGDIEAQDLLRKLSTVLGG